MNQADKITISRDSAMRMIGVLKSLDVKGYDSMYRLVATVDYLEGKLAEEPAKEPVPIRRPAPAPVPRREPVDHEFLPAGSAE